MAYLVSTLINQAWYTSGIVARDLQVPTASQATDGLNLLNDLLAIKSADRRLIPYYALVTIPLVAGQEKYFIANLVDVTSDTFNIGPVRFLMTRLSRRDYFGSPRVDNINALPFTYFFERVLGGGNIYVYFLPSQNFPLNTNGKFALTNVALNTDLLTTIDQFYIVYLRYALAEYMCDFYNISLAPENMKKLQSMEAIITDYNPIDLTMTKYSSLTAQGGITFADANLGRGFRP